MDIDDKAVATEMMFQQMEQNIKNQREFEGLRDRKLAGKQLKMKQLIESQRQLKDDLSDEEKILN